MSTPLFKQYWSNESVREKCFEFICVFMVKKKTKTLLCKKKKNRQMWIEAWHNLCYFTFPQTFEHGWYSQRVHTCFPPNNALRTDIRHFPREPLHDKWDLSFAPQFFFLLHLIAIPRSQSPLRCFISSWTSEGRLSRIRTWRLRGIWQLTLATANSIIAWKQGN